MLVSVTFYVGMRDDWMLQAAVAGRLCGRRRSLLCVVENSVHVSVDSHYSYYHHA